MGCDHSDEAAISYSLSADGTLRCSTVNQKNSRFLGKDTTQSRRFERSFHPALLQSVLARIDAAPRRIPRLQEFGISNHDKADYQKLVDTELSQKKEKFLPIFKIRSRRYLRAVPHRLSGIDSAQLAAALCRREQHFSTSSRSFSVHIVNANHDTCFFYRSYYDDSNGWHLPWTFDDLETRFTCYDPALSKMIRALIPDDFPDADWFSNKHLIRSLAEELAPGQKKD